MERGEVERGEVERGEVERGEVERGEVERGEVERGEVERGEVECRFFVLLWFKNTKVVLLCLILFFECLYFHGIVGCLHIWV